MCQLSLGKLWEQGQMPTMQDRGPGRTGRVKGWAGEEMGGLKDGLKGWAGEKMGGGGDILKWSVIAEAGQR